MPKDIEIYKTLTSFFYDLAKEVPIGQLNPILDEHGHFGGWENADGDSLL